MKKKIKLCPGGWWHRTKGSKHWSLVQLFEDEDSELGVVMDSGCLDYMKEPDTEDEWVGPFKEPKE